MQSAYGFTIVLIDNLSSLNKIISHFVTIHVRINPFSCQKLQKLSFVFLVLRDVIAVLICDHYSIKRKSLGSVDIFVDER